MWILPCGPTPAVICFQSVGALKNHIVFMHFCEQYEATSDCMTCHGSGFNPNGFFVHIEGCMLRWMETRAAEDLSRCPIDYCIENLQISWR